MSKKKVTMDRAAEKILDINTEWVKLNRLLKVKAMADSELAELYVKYTELQGKFANLATLANEQAWRLLAKSNGFVERDEEE